MSTRRMRTQALPALLAALSFSACSSEDRAPELACDAFSSFQRALLEGQRSMCRDLLTVESQQALENIPWQTVGQRKPLAVLGAERGGGNAHTFYVDVVDPNEDDAPGRYVVVREHGKMVVDLVATAGLTAKFVQASEASASREEFVPRELTPADFDRIRAHELAQPKKR
ncbi:MAG: hypothetical protein AB8H80_05210 [Planctomycetota bacterium]